MLGVLPEGGEPYFSAERGSSDAIRRFQEAMGMDPNGHADEDVLREVVSQYLALDGTSLPPETTVVAHGCGEAHPLGGPTDEDRRVDIFIFHPTIDPAPASEVSADEYPQWVEAATAFHEIGVDHDASDHLELRLHDADSDPMPQAPFRVRIGKEPPITGISDDDGFVFLKMPPQCPESIHVEWGDHPHFDYEYSLDVFPACSPADPTSRAITRLNNLGYAPLVDLEAAVRQFQADYRVDHEPIQGLVDGALPPATQARIDEIWDRQTNASRD